MKQPKYIYFEYVVKKLLDWYSENGKNVSNNDFSILKTLKLLFFVSAANSSKGRNSFLLDEVFNNFTAMPYGHVESDIYEAIKKNNGELEYFTINNNKTTTNTGKDPELISDLLELDIKNEIDYSINVLKQKNSRLVLLAPFSLVNLSHAWYSWQHFYSLAERSHSRSCNIPSEFIKSEDKIFSLEAY